MTAEAAATRVGLDRPLTELTGIGPARARRLERMGLRSIRDLLLLIPRRLERLGERMPAAEACAAVGRQVSVGGVVTGLRFHRQGRRRSLLRIRIRDESGSIDALFFNQPWQRERMQAWRADAAPIELHGRVVATKGGPALASPRMGTPDDPLPEPGTLLPHYPLTEGVGQEFLRALARAAAERFAARVDEPLSERALAELDLPPLGDAVRDMHRPDSEEAFHRARRRVVLEPILALQARLARRRAERRGGSARPIRRPSAEAAREIQARFPFEPTACQRRALEEIAEDLANTWPMRRLLQGDVGSGKTFVGLCACMSVASCGGQSVLMAPTELLAEQHYYGLLPLATAAGLQPTLLTGSLPAVRRRAALEALASGAARLAVGTHALFSADVRFRRLDLAVIDEQQRFGVTQRRDLLEKGQDVHALLMTATPIPRTLALTIYGDLEVSVLDEKPPGRGAIETVIVGPENRERHLADLERRLEAGERIFWVTPRIGAESPAVPGEGPAATGEGPAVPGDDEAGDGETTGREVAAAERTFARLRRGPFARHGVELVHGRLSRDDRERRLDRFRSGASQVLVGTTVIEVGVDVPEATAMVIEGAERFGLAQLHQLRGRVGRGPRPSVCLLIPEGEVGERLAVLERTDDGFAIAEEDMCRRGMGDLLGLRQAGESGLGLGDPVQDLRLLLFARDVMAKDVRLRELYGPRRAAP
ncbi:MAG: ATP-dependent DNA helicase RecG [Planctomycetota bacterium]|nr:ATP-dependent DNA helicase RecG [Planctomycetota bacterium]